MAMVDSRATVANTLSVFGRTAPVSDRPPMPWTNVIANEHAGFLVTESGAGYTWCGNSRTNRLTAWNNDPLCDPHGRSALDPR